VRALAPELAQSADAVIVSAFGDPGAVGIAEAGMRAASANGRRFAVVTHTGGWFDAWPCGQKKSDLERTASVWGDRA